MPITFPVITYMLLSDRRIVSGRLLKVQSKNVKK